MATPKRTSLAERRRAAMADLDEPTPAAEPKAEAEPAPEPQAPKQPARTSTKTSTNKTATTKAATKNAAETADVDKPSRKPRKSAAERAREQGKAPLGLYFPEPADLDDARRAFVTDFHDSDGPDTFAEWVSAAVLDHAARTPAERAELAQPRRQRKTGVKGVLRKIDVRREVAEAVEHGMAEDRTTLRRQVSISSWCHDAVMAAVETTKQRTPGGQLMTIDGTLPPKLKK